MATAYTDSDAVIHMQHTGTSFESTVHPVGLKCFGAELTDEADDGDTLALTLANYGITTVWDVWAFTHSTTDSAIITETTELTSLDVTSGVLTITVPGTTDNKKRFFVIWGV